MFMCFLKKEQVLLGKPLKKSNNKYFMKYETYFQQ